MINLEPLLVRLFFCARLAENQFRIGFHINSFHLIWFSFFIKIFIKKEEKK